MRPHQCRAWREERATRGGPGKRGHAAKKRAGGAHGRERAVAGSNCCARDRAAPAGRRKAQGARERKWRQEWRQGWAAPLLKRLEVLRHGRQMETVVRQLQLGAGLERDAEGLGLAPNQRNRPLRATAPSTHARRQHPREMRQPASMPMPLQHDRASKRLQSSTRGTTSLAAHARSA